MLGPFFLDKGLEGLIDYQSLQSRMDSLFLQIIQARSLWPSSNRSTVQGLVCVRLRSWDDTGVFLSGPDQGKIIYVVAFQFWSGPCKHEVVQSDR